MAQNTWLNTTVGKNSASIPDKNSHSHACSGGTAAAGDMTVSWDSAVVTNINIWDSVVAASRLRAVASGLK